MMMTQETKHSIELTEDQVKSTINALMERSNTLADRKEKLDIKLKQSLWTTPSSLKVYGGILIDLKQVSQVALALCEVLSPDDLKTGAVKICNNNLLSAQRLIDVIALAMSHESEDDLN